MVVDVRARVELRKEILAMSPQRLEPVEAGNLKQAQPLEIVESLAMST